MSETTAQSAIFTVSRPRRDNQLFKMSKGEGSHIVYCTQDGDGEKSSASHIFTNLYDNLEDQKRCIRQTLAYKKDHVLTNKVIAWFEKLPA